MMGTAMENVLDELKAALVKHAGADEAALANLDASFRRTIPGTVRLVIDACVGYADARIEIGEDKRAAAEDAAADKRAAAEKAAADKRAAAEKAAAKKAGK